MNIKSLLVGILKKLVQFAMFGEFLFENDNEYIHYLHHHNDNIDLGIKKIVSKINISNVYKLLGRCINLQFALSCRLFIIGCVLVTFLFYFMNQRNSIFDMINFSNYNFKYNPFNINYNKSQSKFRIVKQA